MDHKNSVTYYGREKARIRETVCNIRIIAGPDQGIKGIGGPKKNFIFIIQKHAKSMKY